METGIISLDIRTQIETQTIPEKIKVQIAI